MTFRLPPATPSKLKGKLLGLYERHYAWSMEDDSGKPGGKYGYRRPRWRLWRTGSLVTLLCLMLYIVFRFFTVMTEDAVAHTVAPTVPQTIRRVLNTASADLPDFQQRRNFLPEDEFKRLQRELRRHPALDKFEKRPIGEVGTKGLHMTFNTNGIRRLASDPDLAALFKFFQAVRYLDANAWKLNLFVMDTTPGFVADEGVFGVHHDTLATNSGLDEWKPYEELEIFSHITSVLYISYPRDMKGGHLLLWPPRRNIEHTYFQDVLPAHVLRPQENVLTEFRGDCFHGVSGFTSAWRDEPRMSVVLEQFRVPTAMYNVTWEWRKRTYTSRFPLDTIRDSPSYYLLDDAQRRHVQSLVKV
eukprot:jgi/Botrbrau1/18623/Bobra.0367s0060.1